MLKLVSRFVLEVLPYVLTALIAAIVVPGFLSSQLHGSQLRSALNGPNAVGAFEYWCAVSPPAVCSNQLTAK
jgi:branched-subunit amino acid transport protein